MLKRVLSIVLVLAASAATATPFLVDAPAPPARATVVQPDAARPDINCGFICDSFGRCRRVCW